MKKIILTVLAVLLILPTISANAEITLAESALKVSAKAAILLDTATGGIIYEKNANEKLSMASTTKILTALLAQDYIDSMGDGIVTITKEMVAVEGSSMGLKIGDKISLSNLILGMLLPSGNDAANAAAIYMGKTLDNFAVQMNKRAQGIGMENSNFVRPSGLDHKEHYSTAYDMALLTKEVANNENLQKIFALKSDTVEYNRGKSKLWLKNHNKLLSMYEYCIGGKTGFTKKSGRCLVSVAKQNGCTLIAVTLNAPDDWSDHINMFNYGFSQIKEKSFGEEIYVLPKAEGGSVTVKILPVVKYYITGKPPKRTINLPRFIYSSTLNQELSLGKIVYYTGNKEIEKFEIFKE